MKGKRFTDEQITYALRQAEGGTPVAEVCRQIGVSEASFYLWKKNMASRASQRFVSCGNCAMRTRASSA